MMEANRLVICSSPIDDDYVGEKYSANFCNICEYAWQEIYEKTKQHNEVILENNSDDREDALRLKTFANIYNFKFDYTIQPSFYTNFSTNKKIDDNQLLMVGCSHTEGIGHPTIETRYTTKVSKLLGLHPLVDAHSGRGNYLTEEKLNSYNLKNKKVIIQLTDPYRIWLNGKKTGGPSYTKEQSKIFTDEVVVSAFIEQVKRIVNFLRANACEFVLFQVSGGPSPSSPLPFQEEIPCILTQYNEFLHIKDYKLDRAEDDTHFGPISHTYWSNELYSHYKNLYMQKKLLTDGLE